MSRPAARENHIDSEPLFSGTHKGSDASDTLFDPGACFRSLGVDPSLSLMIENTTTGDTAKVVGATDDAVECESEAGAVFPIVLPAVLIGLTWNRGDGYAIYKTATKNSLISSTWVDRSRGWKVTRNDKIDKYGWRAEDTDIDDRGRSTVFGPGQGR
jgi:hypothetical protein